MSVFKGKSGKALVDELRNCCKVAGGTSGGKTGVGAVAGQLTAKDIKDACPDCPDDLCEEACAAICCNLQAIDHVIACCQNCPKP